MCVNIDRQWANLAMLIQPIFHLATLFAQCEAKIRIRQRDSLTLVGEKIRREQAETVNTFFLFAQTNSPSGKRALGKDGGETLTALTSANIILTSRLK